MPKARRQSNYTVPSGNSKKEALTSKQKHIDPVKGTQLPVYYRHKKAKLNESYLKQGDNDNKAITNSVDRDSVASQNDTKCRWKTCESKAQMQGYCWEHYK